MPPWIAFPSTTVILGDNRYTNTTANTYVRSGTENLTVWAQDQWTLGVMAFGNSSALTAGSAFAHAVLPGRGSLLWTYHMEWHLAAGWCVHHRGYRLGLNNLEPGAAPLAAAVFGAWRPGGPHRFLCRARHRHIACKALPRS